MTWGDLLAFERLITRTSAALVAAPSDEVGAKIRDSLESIVSFFDVDRSMFGSIAADGREEHKETTIYARPGIPTVAAAARAELEVPWINERLRRGEVFVMTSPQDLPAEATLEREAAARSGIDSSLVVPVSAGSSTRYYLSLDSFRGPREWSHEVIQRLTLLARLFAGAWERARAELELRASQASIDALRARLPVVVWTTDADLRFTSTGGAGLRPIGGTPNANVGRTIYDYFGTRDPDFAPVRGLQQALAGDVVDFEAEWGGRHFLCHVDPVTDTAGRVTGTSGIALDVSELRAAERALRHREELFRDLAENIHEVFWVTDPAKARIFYVSPAYETIWGRSCQSLIAAPSSWMDAVHPADRARVEQAAMRQTGEKYDETYRIVRPDGSLRWIRDRAFPVRSADRVERIVGVAEDVSDLRRAEELLRQSQKMEAIGSLAGGVAHDFNNLLAIILSYSGLLLDDLPAGDPARREVEEIKMAGERAAELTRQLLAFSRKQVLSPRVLDLSQSVLSMERMLRRLLGAQVELALLAQSKGRVRADPSQVDQVIMNLAVNARDAMPHGGRLTIETSDVLVGTEREPEGLPPGWCVRLTFGDTGVGIAPAILPRVFEPFFTTKERGTGLGLATVFGIVKQSGGIVAVASEPGKGTMFEVLLPRVDEPVSDPAAVPQPGESLRGGETILVVEDEEQVRHLVGTILRRYGYEVLEVSNGGEALLVCEQTETPIHLLLSDVVLPRMSGPDLATRLAPLHPEMRTLFMSGYVDERHVGVLDVPFVQKPFAPQTLVRRVREILSSPQPGRHFRSR